MFWLLKPRFIKRILFGTLFFTLLVFIILLVICPLIFKLSWTLQRSVLFLNFVNHPRNVNFSNPEKANITGTRNFYLTTNDDIKIGVWQILPEHLLNVSVGQNEAFYNEVINNGFPILLYMHGNSGNRAADHRIALYKLLRKYFHVFTYDYRGYGDSTNTEPTEIGVVSDSKYVLEWLMNRTKSSIFVWGHSLGTGISTHVLDLLETERKAEIQGLILESPFNNLRDEIAEHPFSTLFKHLPWFHYFITDPMYENGLRFETDQHILRFNAPVLILHAEDDIVIPYKLGYKLYQHALTNRNSSQGAVYFQKFESKHGFGHKFIYRSPNIINIVLNFTKEYVDKKTADLMDLHTL